MSTFENQQRNKQAKNKDQSFNHLINIETQKVYNIKRIILVFIICICSLIITYLHTFKGISQISTKNISFQFGRKLQFSLNSNNLYQENQNQNNKVNIQLSKSKKQVVSLYSEQTKRILIPQQESFCVIIQSNNHQQILRNQLSSLTKQQYKKWNAIFYITQNYQTLSSKLTHNQIKILKSLGNIGKNIYNGIINECPQKSIIVTLKEDEVLFNQFTLQNIYNEISNHFNIVVSAFISQENLIKPTKDILSFQRDKYFKLYQRRQDLSLVSKLISHIRIFKSSMYRRIPYIELMYENQTFFQSELSYIIPILELNSQNHFHKKKSHHILRSKTILYSSSKQLNDITDSNLIDQINAIGQKQKFMNSKLFLQTMGYYGLFRQPKLWNINKNLDILKRNISKSQKLIPQIIHQIWVGSQIPDYKKKFMSRFKEVMPEYQYKLWGEENITKQNFPFTYQYILKLKQIDKTSQYSRQSMIADLMKFQIVYHHGGFYYDTNYQPFQNLQHLRHYPFIGVIQQSIFFGEYISTSPMGAQKNSPYLKKILTQQSLKNINLTSPKANIETGPFYLGKAFTLEDYYYHVKIITPEHIFPYMPWSVDRRKKKSPCSFNRVQDIPKQATYQQVIHAKQFYQIAPCRNQYPHEAYKIYGTDYWHLGASWQKKKNQQLKTK